MDDKTKQVDTITGTTTTGHEWDGIRELNTPLPRWWLWMFYATHRLVGRLLDRLSGVAAGDRVHQRRIRLAVTRSDPERSCRTAGTARRDDGRARCASPADQMPPIRNCCDFARAVGPHPLSPINCAPCHGAGGGGAKGYPNLNDDEWLWGGKLEDIDQTIRYGIRSTDDKTRHQPDACLRTRRRAAAGRISRRWRIMSLKLAGRRGGPGQSSTQGAKGLR